MYVTSYDQTFCNKTTNVQCTCTCICTSLVHKDEVTHLTTL